MSKVLATRLTAPIVAASKKQGVNIVLKSLIALAVIVIILTTVFFLMFGQGKSKQLVKRERSDQVLATKEAWSLSSIAKNYLAEGEKSQEEPVRELSRSAPPVKGLLKTQKARPREFKKYQSIPTKSQISSEMVEENQSSTTTGSLDADSVTAESIKIDPDFLLQEGTYIPCSLTTRFVSEVAGKIQCMVNQDVYSASGRVKLIERGTKAIGMYQGGTLEHGRGRMHVIWTKLLTPDHKRINLVDTQVVGRLGETGIDGRVDSHFMQRFGGALMISFIQDVVSHATERHASHSRRNTININSYEKTRDGITSVVEKMLDSSVGIPPTMYKKQGDIVGIEVGKDIDFSKIYSLKVKHGA